MGLSRFAGTLGAVLAGGAVVGGGSTAAPLPVALAVGGVVAAAFAYALGDGRFPLLVASTLYLGAGAAVLSDLITAPEAVAGPLVGVGAVVLVGYLVRYRVGNARRVATLPVDPGRFRRFEAAVARRVLSVQSAVGWVADLGVGTVRVGAVVLVAAWAGATAGLSLLWTDVPATTALAVEAGLLVALLVPFYRGTDWFAVDAPEGPAPTTLGQRLAAVSAAFVREPPEGEAIDEGADDVRATVPARDGGGEARRATSTTETGTDAPETDPGTTGSAAEERDEAEEEFEDLPQAEDMGPVSWGRGDSGGAWSDPAPEEPEEADPESTEESADPDDWPVPPDPGDGEDDEDAETAVEGAGEGTEDDADDGDPAEEPEDSDPIDGDASPAREALGVYERVTEILGDGPDTGSELEEDWKERGGDGEDDGENASWGDDGADGDEFGDADGKPSDADGDSSDADENADDENDLTIDWDMDLEDDPDVELGDDADTDEEDDPDTGLGDHSDADLGEHSDTDLQDDSDTNGEDDPEEDPD